MRFLKFLVKKFFPKRLLRKITDWHFGIIRAKNGQFYSGNAVSCPCCGKRFSRFMDFKFNGLKDANRYKAACKNTVCPYCFSFPRHRIACYFFEQNKKIIPHGNILMIGAEPSIINWFDRNNCRYITADLFDRTADVKVDIQNMPFPDESWELIICNHVLEHVPDYITALKELKRVMKKNGMLELTVPTDRNYKTVYEDSGIVKKEDRIKHFGQHDHIRIFGTEFEKILIEAGYSAEIIYGGELPAEIAGIRGPADYDDNKVYICRKNEN